MCFKQQGEANLNIALYLNKKDMSNLGKMSKQELASVIINRLYYGVFLMAKELVKQNSSQVSSHNHRFLWRQVGNILQQRQNNFDRVSFIAIVDELRTTRNEYDYDEYCAYNTTKIDDDIEECFKCKQDIYNVLYQYI